MCMEESRSNTAALPPRSYSPSFSTCMYAFVCTFSTLIRMIPARTVIHGVSDILTVAFTCGTQC